MALKQIKNKIVATLKTGKVTKAMEAVSAVKMRKSQALAINTRPYALAALKILRSISGAIEAAQHPLMSVRPVKRSLVVVISSEMQELLGISDRIYVMNEGRFVAEMPAKQATQEKIMRAIMKSWEG